MALIRLSASAARQERLLRERLGGADPDAQPRLVQAVEDAWLLGCLALSGIPADWPQVVASRTRPAAGALGGLRSARAAVPRGAAVGTAELLAWHRAATGETGGLRGADRERAGGPPPAPAALLPGRLQILSEWLAAPSGRELKPAEAGALVLARVVELLPFDDGNGRVSRLAAAHAVERAGGRLPILVAADRPRLDAALQSAFRLETAPLAELLEEASERAAVVMLQTLEGRG